MRLLLPAEGVAYVPSWVFDLGWWAVFLLLLVVVFFRAQATYWLGRAAVAGALKTTWRRRFEGPVMSQAHTFLEKWGIIGVPVSFLTIGFQTAVQAAAGFARMRYPVYTAVMIPGCVVWASLYTAIAVTTVTLAQNVIWWGTALVSIVLIVGLAVLVIRRRRSADSAASIPR